MSETYDKVGGGPLWDCDEEKKIVELMRNFDLSYQEIVLVLQEGLLPAINAIGQYKKPPWSKETTPEMDRYCQKLSSKYESLFGYLNE